MTADEYRELMETELGWRQEEFAFFKNQLNDLPERQRDRYRKGLVMILREHLQGYLSICLQTYVQYINWQQLTGKEVSLQFLAAGMRKAAKDASSQLPVTDDFYRFYQQVNWLEEAESLKGQTLKLDDSLFDLIDPIDPMCGCGYQNLQKNLYRIGLPLDLFDAYQNDLDAFISHSSGIARGIFRAGVTQQELEYWESIASGIASGVMKQLYNYVKYEKYLMRNHDTY